MAHPVSPLARSWAEISVAALRHNVRFLKSRFASPNVGWIPAVKANAYGHGVGIAAKLFCEEGASMLGVANLAEGLELQGLGIKAPVLILGSCLKAELPEVVRAGFCPTLSNLEQARRYNAEARKQGRKLAVHLKLDTGMSRLGCWHGEAEAFFKGVKPLSHLNVEAVYTHFASADDDPVMTAQQWKLFLTSLLALGQGLGTEIKHHASNSAGLLRYPEMDGDWVRPGIALYGSSPVAKFQRELKPVMTWKARVTLIKELAKGRTVSYGATFRTARRMTLAVLSAGYADGYRRSFSNQGRVYLNGKFAPVVGRVTMDQILVDVSRIKGVKEGDAAELLGPHIPVESLAEMDKTISYEIFTGVGLRVPRIAT